MDRLSVAEHSMTPDFVASLSYISFCPSAHFSPHL